METWKNIGLLAMNTALGLVLWLGLDMRKQLAELDRKVDTIYISGSPHIEQLSNRQMADYGVLNGRINKAEDDITDVKMQYVEILAEMKAIKAMLQVRHTEGYE